MEYFDKEERNQAVASSTRDASFEQKVETLGITWQITLNLFDFLASPKFRNMEKPGCKSGSPTHFPKFQVSLGT